MAFQPASLRSAARSAYLEHFRSLTAFIPFSQGNLSSGSNMVLYDTDHIIRSGQSGVFTISMGNWRSFSRSSHKVNSLPTTQSALHCCSICTHKPAHIHTVSRSGNT
ncbi:hypothetical protein GOODEAATRI_015300 [Goodea atripinnis]|uniref:Uncharacterized protein n=1 Tax=Goodea atripinnis TaxID=208336 RepID=A0ABV0PEA0_9TELE